MRRGIDADARDLAEVDRAERGDVGHREALAGEVRALPQLALEPVEAAGDELAHDLASRIDVPIVLCDVSRLVIDVNRWVDDPRSIPVALEGTPIALNKALSAAEREARQDAVFWPYHRLLGEIWARQTARHSRPFFFALHSCTRVFDGQHRPWDGGTIWHDDDTLSRHLLGHLGTEKGLVLGDNQPYSGRSGVYTVDWHSYGTGLPACGFEVTNDLLETGPDRARWASRLAGALTAAIDREVAA